MVLQFLRFYVFLVSEFIYASVHKCLAFVVMYETVDKSPHCGQYLSWTLGFHYAIYFRTRTPTDFCLNV